MRYLTIAAILVGAMSATERIHNLYKVAHINQSVVGISCPGNNGDPTVVGNIEGTLVISCGTK